MRFTLSWLKEHFETNAPLDIITEKLTALGLVVDKVENKAQELSSFTICEIVSAEKHPSADRLQVCRVNTGSETLQIVCGATNARVGLKTVFARPGTLIPSTKQVLKVGKVRDVESFGMMCSARELLLGEDEGGIIEVDLSAPVGESYAQWLGLDDPVIEIEISPNRGDCLGVYGIARDLSATGLGSLKPLKRETVQGTFPCPVSINGDLEACLHFTARLIKGVKNGPSPEWLQRKLIEIGLRPISALVDITNYFTFDRSRPLHVFDVDKLKGPLNIRLSRKGETFDALDGKTYTLNDGMSVITDDSGVISLGGIMGGMSTGCDENTTNVLLEAGLFDPILTAMTGRTLGINSDSRFRFERGVDPASTLPGLEAATQMILELCGGEASHIVETGHAPDFRQRLSFSPARIESLGGTVVPLEQVKSILMRLGFEVTGEGKTLSVLTPSWRFGIDHEADFVEEILRVEGYDKIPAVSYGERPQQKPLGFQQTRRFIARDRLSNRGLMEVVTWSFMSQKEAEPFGGVKESLVLLNPISQDLDRMRPSLLPNLLKAALYNQNRGIESVALFEVGPQYADPTPQGQHMMATGVRTGAFQTGSWSEKKRPVDLYDAKGDAIALMEMANLSPQWDPKAPKWYHPGRSATLKLGPQVLGYFGEVHPRILKIFDLKGPVVAFEVFLDHMPLPKRKATAKPLLVLSPFQAVERDFAFVVNLDIPADTLLKAAKKADPSMIEECTLFDVFELKDGQKSLGIRVRFQPKDHTLNDEEIQALSEKIISSIIQSTGGALRQ